MPDPRQPYELEYTQASTGDLMLERFTGEEDMSARAAFLVNRAICQPGSVKLFYVRRTPIGVGRRIARAGDVQPVTSERIVP